MIPNCSSGFRRRRGRGAGGGGSNAPMGLAFVFDAMHRFIHPVSVGLDREAPEAALQQRVDRVTRVVARALTTGRV